jgi:hypothetical protein
MSAHGSADHLISGYFPLHFITLPRSARTCNKNLPIICGQPRIKIAWAADPLPSPAGIVNTTSVLFNHGRVVLEPLYHFEKALLECVFRMPT